MEPVQAMGVERWPQKFAESQPLTPKGPGLSQNFADRSRRPERQVARVQAQRIILVRKRRNLPQAVASEQVARSFYRCLFEWESVAHQPS